MAVMLTAHSAPTIYAETSPQRSRHETSFYTQLFGWTTTDVDMGSMGSYAMFQQNSPHIGGLVRVRGGEWEGLPPRWALYVQVDNVDSRARKAVELGGQIWVPPFDIPNTGRACVVLDPEGASFYLFTPRLKAESGHR